MKDGFVEKMQEFPELKGLPPELVIPLTNLFYEGFMPLFRYLDSLILDVEESDSALYRCGRTSQALTEVCNGRLSKLLQAHVAK